MLFLVFGAPLETSVSSYVSYMEIYIEGELMYPANENRLCTYGGELSRS